MKHKKKMYLVKYEVIASTVKEALRKKGQVYEVSLADEKNWPEENKPMLRDNKNK